MYINPHALLSLVTGILILIRPALLNYIMFTANTFLKSASSAALTSLQHAANDPAVKADASADLYSAEKLLQHAETSWQEDHDVEETDHLSYFRHRRICHHQTFRALTTSIV